MSLVMLGRDMEAVPGAALGWESSADMKTWTFDIDSSLHWSDETPVSAGDFVFTWQYYADPDHAYDYAAYFARLGVTNWERVNLGVLPLSDLGVEATDDQTLVFHLDRPTPHVPRFLVYGAPLARHQALLHGTLYGNDPETAVSFTPWILTDWKPNQHSMFEPNLEYTGRLQPKIEKVKFVFSENGFDQYRAGAIDSISGPFGSAEQAQILNDPDLVDERGASPGDFRTHYLTFNFRDELFADSRVRRSIAHAVDRRLLIDSVVGQGSGVPSYGILMAGFPDAVTEELRTFQRLNLARARALLTGAGYPNGEGFPRIELAPRSQSVFGQTVASVITEQLAQNLGIEIDVVDRDELGAPDTQAPRITLDAIGADYLDASSFLRVFKTNGRHNWNDDEFEALRLAAIENPDPEERQAQTMELQTMLSEQAADVFLWSEVRAQLHKPYLKGPWRDENAAGWSGLQPPGWSPGFGAHNIYTVYVGDDVSGYDRSPF